MRRAIVLVAALAAVGVASIASAAGGGGSFRTFGGGDVVTQGDRAMFLITPGKHAAVWEKSKSMPVGKVHFSMVSYGDVQGGAPRFSIPLDTDGVRATVESYAFLDAANSGGVVGDNPTNTPTVVSTELAGSKVFINTGGEYANWAALVAAHPTWRTAKSPAFVIADVPGDYHVKDIHFYK